MTSAALRLASYFVSLYFVNVSERNLTYIHFTLNFFDNGLAMHLSSNLKDIFLKYCVSSYDIITVCCPFPFLLHSATNHFFGTPIILLWTNAG